MLKNVLTAVILTAGSLILLGCDDDATETPVETVAAKMLLLGRANLYPHPNFYMEAFAMTNEPIGIDSAYAYDSLCQIWNNSYWFAYGDNNYQWLEFDNSDDTGRYQSGDTMTLTIYQNGQSVSAMIKLLDNNDDRPSVLLPLAGDTVALGSDIECAWSKVEHADWYGIYTRYQKDSAGTQVYTYSYYSTGDTTFTIPGSINTFNGIYEIYLISATGPGVNEPLNINGGEMIGELISYTSNTSVRRNYVGTGDPSPASRKLSHSSHVTADKDLADEIMHHIIFDKIK